MECADEATDIDIPLEKKFPVPLLAADLGKDVDVRPVNQGTKLSPVCVDEEMKKQAMPAEELKKHCFPAGFSLLNLSLEDGLLGSRVTDTDQKPKGFSPELGVTDLVLTNLMEKSATINCNVCDRRISRHGRSTQRWLVDSNNSSKISRLVTGCVPILSGGKILLVSASKKNEWILPKGGWEIDEDIEESAIRETFEEAGVIGVLGPRLCEVKYETRKAKQRRRAEENGKIIKAAATTPFIKAKTGDMPHESPKQGTSVRQSSAEEGRGGKDSRAEKEFTEGRGAAEPTMVYDEVCLSLFPLYVHNVMSSWPESGRLRRLVDIDEAIDLLSSRPEMQSMLLEVKSKSLHFV